LEILLVPDRRHRYRRHPEEEEEEEVALVSSLKQRARASIDA
jgi:hypothetical protein